MNVTVVEKVEVLSRSFASCGTTRMLKCLVQINVPDGHNNVRRVKVKIKVLVSPVDRRQQSYGHAQVFSLDKLKWNRLASLASSEMKSVCSESNEENFQKDCDALIEMAKKILL